MAAETLNPARAVRKDAHHGPDLVTYGPLARDALAALDRARVRWALLRDPGGARDIDLLIAAADLPRAVAALERHGLLRLGGRPGDPSAFLAGLAEPCSWTQFDLATEVAFGRRGELRTTAATDCLARRRREGGAWVLDRDDEFWVLLLHCLLDKATFPARHLRRLAALAPSASLHSPVARAVPAGVPRRTLLQRARAGHWRALAAAAPAVRDAWRVSGSPTAPRLASVRVALSRLGRAPRSAWRRRGLSVALLGPDGAGKSSLAAGIQASFYFPVRTVYMGLWSRSGMPEPGPVGSALRAVRRPFVVWARYLTALRHRAAGRLVVFDRYVFDAMLPPRGSLVWLKRPYLWLLGRSCPAPDLVILLDAPGHLMHQRSGERGTAELEAERVHFARIAERIPRVVRVDTDRPAEVVLADAVGHIWRQYLARSGR